MLGKELIKAILDNNLVDEDIVIVGSTDDGVLDVETTPVTIEEVGVFEVDTGDVCGIFVNALINT